MNDFEKAHESWLAEREHLLAEVERLQRESDNNIEAFNRVAEENERLRLERDNAGGKPWGDYQETVAEVERLREVMATTESTAVVEVKRLQQLNADFQAAWARARQDMKTEIERLRAGMDEKIRHETALNNMLRDIRQEVERLREALDQIAHIDHMRLGWGEELQRIARAALAKEET